MKVNFQKENMGCKYGVISAITWAFEHVDELIILEEDGLPDLSFFRFCRELLDKYRDDNRVFSINGPNCDRTEPFEESYCFTRSFHGYGWATWKRAWKVFDITMKLWPKFRQDKYLKNAVIKDSSRKLIDSEYQMTYEGKIITWDYLWSLSCRVNNALHIVPKVNLVQNIGFTGGTYTSYPGFDHLYVDESMTFPLTHPDIILPLDRLAELPTVPENPNERIEFYKECERTLNEYDAVFRQFLNLKQFHAVIILFKEVLRKRITPQLTQWHLNFVWYNALAYFNLGDFERAESMTEILLAFNPQNVELLLFLANICMNRQNFQRVGELVAQMKSLNVTNDGQRAQIDSLAHVLANLNVGRTN